MHGKAQVANDQLKADTADSLARLRWSDKYDVASQLVLEVDVYADIVARSAREEPHPYRSNISHLSIPACFFL